jgi:uncharacterized alkaline shock family protein YloU
MSPSDRSRPAATRDLLRATHSELACGASVDDLLAQVADDQADRLTGHQLQCPHCQAAITELTALWSPVHEFAREPVAAPRQLRATVMRHINRLVEDVWYTLQLNEGGAIRVAARVVAGIARDSAAGVPGVRVALGRSTDSRIAAMVRNATHRHRHPHAAVGVLGRTAVIDLALAVTYNQPVHDVARQVQRRVMHELRDTVGLQSITVNVTVDDVLPPPGS